MSKINFFHNLELFKQHLNFTGSAEQPKRMDIVELARTKAEINNLIASHKVSPNSFNNDFLEYLKSIHAKKHIDEITHSPKYLTATYPLKTFVQTFDTAIKDNQISFYAMRPPGHHSFNGGLHKDDDFDGGYQVGEGYCYFNNIAFASVLANIKYAKKSILIIDWDYHHGNGTQSTLFDVKDDYISAKFDTFDTYFISFHNATIYPYNEDPDLEPNNYATVCGKADNSNNFIKNIHTAKKDYLDDIFLPKFYRTIDEAFENIDPDLVLISAGFDARNGDPVAKFTKDEGLSDNAYLQMTKYLKSKLKKSSNNTPIISLLEGGYNITDSGFSEALYQHLNGFSTE